MEWTADVSAGDWIRARLDADGPGWGSTMHCAVPRGYPAYARIFHRPSVSWVPGRPFPTQGEWREMSPEDWPRTEHAATTWAEAAAVFGTELHGTAQWNRIVRRATDGWDPNDWQQVTGPDGRQYGAPEEGALDAEQLSATARHLAAATTTPDDTFIALWEGWGGILGFLGEAPSAAIADIPAVDDSEPVTRYASLAERPPDDAHRPLEWRPGVLSDQISTGGRFTLPNRDHVLFRGRLGELSDPRWPSAVPWAEERGRTLSPSLLWPADHAWVLVTEVDWDSTIVAGAPELVRALCTDPGLEARALREGADLTWDADEVNR